MKFSVATLALVASMAMATITQDADVLQYFVPVEIDSALSTDLMNIFQTASARLAISKGEKSGVLVVPPADIIKGDRSKTLADYLELQQKYAASKGRYDTLDILADNKEAAEAVIWWIISLTPVPSFPFDYRDAVITAYHMFIAQESAKEAAKNGHDIIVKPQVVVNDNSKIQEYLNSLYTQIVALFENQKIVINDAKEAVKTEVDNKALTLATDLGAAIEKAKLYLESIIKTLKDDIHADVTDAVSQISGLISGLQDKLKGFSDLNKTAIDDNTKSLNTLIEDINVQATSLNDILAAIKKNDPIPEIKALSEHLHHDTAEIDGYIKDLSKQVTTLSENQKTIIGDAEKAFKTDVDSAVTKSALTLANDLGERINGIQTYLDTQIQLITSGQSPDLSGALDEVSRKIDEILEKQKGFADLKAGIGSNSDTLNTLLGEVNAQATSLNSLKSAIDAHDPIPLINALSGQLHQDTVEIEGYLNDLSNQLTTLSNNQKTIIGDAEVAFKTDVDSTVNQSALSLANELKKKIDDAQSYLDGQLKLIASGQSPDLSAALGEVSGKIDEILEKQKGFADLKADIGSNSDSLNTLLGEVNAQATSLNSLKSAIDAHDPIPLLNALSGHLHHDTVEIEGYLQSLHEQLTTLSDNQKTIIGDAEVAFKTDVDSTVHQSALSLANELKKKIDDAQTYLDGQLKLIAAGQSPDLSAALGEVSGKIDEILEKQEGFADLKAGIGSNSASLNTLLGEVDVQTTSLNSLKSAIDAHDPIPLLNALSGHLHHDTVEIEGYLQSLHEQLTTLSDNQKTIIGDAEVAFKTDVDSTVNQSALSLANELKQKIDDAQTYLDGQLKQIAAGQSPDLSAALGEVSGKIDDILKKQSGFADLKADIGSNSDSLNTLLGEIDSQTTSLTSLKSALIAHDPIPLVTALTGQLYHDTVEIEGYLNDLSNQLTTLYNNQKTVIGLAEEAIKSDVDSTVTSNALGLAKELGEKIQGVQTYLDEQLKKAASGQSSDLSIAVGQITGKITEILEKQKGFADLNTAAINSNTATLNVLVGDIDAQSTSLTSLKSALIAHDPIPLVTALTGQLYHDTVEIEGYLNDLSNQLTTLYNNQKTVIGLAEEAIKSDVDSTVTSNALGLAKELGEKIQGVQTYLDEQLKKVASGQSSDLSIAVGQITGKITEILEKQKGFADLNTAAINSNTATLNVLVGDIDAQSTSLTSLKSALIAHDPIPLVTALTGQLYHDTVEIEGYLNDLSNQLTTLYQNQKIVIGQAEEAIKSDVDSTVTKNALSLANGLGTQIQAVQSYLDGLLKQISSSNGKLQVDLVSSSQYLAGKIHDLLVQQQGFAEIGQAAITANSETLTTLVGDVNFQTASLKQIWEALQKHDPIPHIDALVIELSKDSKDIKEYLLTLYKRVNALFDAQQTIAIDADKTAKAAIAEANAAAAAAANAASKTAKLQAEQISALQTKLEGLIRQVSNQSHVDITKAVQELAADFKELLAKQNVTLTETVNAASDANSKQLSSLAGELKTQSESVQGLWEYLKQQNAAEKPIVEEFGQGMKDILAYLQSLQHDVKDLTEGQKDVVEKAEKAAKAAAEEEANAIAASVAAAAAETAKTQAEQFAALQKHLEELEKQVAVSKQENHADNVETAGKLGKEIDVKIDQLDNKIQDLLVEQDHSVADTVKAASDYNSQQLHALSEQLKAQSEAIKKLLNKKQKDVVINYQPVTVLPESNKDVSVYLVSIQEEINKRYEEHKLVIEEAEKAKAAAEKNSDAAVVAACEAAIKKAKEEDVRFSEVKKLLEDLHSNVDGSKTVNEEAVHVSISEIAQKTLELWIAQQQTATEIEKAYTDSHSEELHALSDKFKDQAAHTYQFWCEQQQQPSHGLPETPKAQVEFFDDLHTKVLGQVESQKTIVQVAENAKVTVQKQSGSAAADFVTSVIEKVKAHAAKYVTIQHQLEVVKKHASEDTKVVHNGTISHDVADLDHQTHELWTEQCQVAIDTGKAAFTFHSQDLEVLAVKLQSQSDETYKLWAVQHKGANPTPPVLDVIVKEDVKVVSKEFSYTTVYVKDAPVTSVDVKGSTHVEAAHTTVTATIRETIVVQSPKPTPAHKVEDVVTVFVTDCPVTTVDAHGSTRVETIKSTVTSTITKVVAETPKPQAPAPIVEAPKPKAPAPIVQASKPVVPAPAASAPAPKPEAPAPKASAPAPKPEAPAPKASAPAPKPEAPVPQAPKAPVAAPVAPAATPKAEPAPKVVPAPVAPAKVPAVHTLSSSFRPAPTQAPALVVPAQVNGAPRVAAGVFVAIPMVIAALL